MNVRWRNLRLVLLGIGFGSSFYAASAEAAGVDMFEELSRSELIAMLVTPLVFFPVSMLVLVGLHTRNPFMARVWTIPTHGSNPFRLADPLHFFHFGAYFSGASGLGYLAAGNEHVTLGWMCISMFVGLTLGVRLFPLVFGQKFEPQARNRHKQADHSQSSSPR